MPRWVPDREWEGQDAYVIGGGPSLRSFDWELLRGKNTVGANGAYSLGHSICKILIFVDVRWWQEIGFKGTQDYGGTVIGCNPKFHTRRGKELQRQAPWLMIATQDRSNSLSKDGIVAGNSGLAALHIALLKGAQRVFLLGFDMKLGEPDKETDEFNRRRGNPKGWGRPNWHSDRYEVGRPDVYKRFIQQFNRILPSIRINFPGQTVYNVSDDSGLPSFPIVSLADHFQKGKP